MKMIIKNLFFLLLLIIGFNSCRDKSYYYEEVVTYEEILQPISDIRNSFNVREDFEIVKPGNIYTYGKYLLVGEKMKGIHIVDNSVPSNPVKIKFIDLMGNENFAVYNNTLIADNGPDLLSIDISDLNNITLKHREQNVNDFNSKGDKFVAGYNTVKKKVKVYYEDRDRMGGGTRFSSQSGTNGTASTPSTGKGGSMSKFAIIDNFLYIVNSKELRPVNISNPALPSVKNKVGLSSNSVETVFPYKSYLYMGTSNGVLIHNCAGSKEAPAYVGTLTHVVGCDPVVVSDDYAFSTVRGGTVCRNTSSNQINIYDVTVPSSSNFAVESVNLLEPYGLGVKDKVVFVCQGTKGLFVYNWDKINRNLTFRHSYPDIHAFDVIVNGNVLIVTADNGLFQFDITNPDNITYMSKLVNFN